MEPNVLVTPNPETDRKTRVLDSGGGTTETTDVSGGTMKDLCGLPVSKVPKKVR